MRSSTLAGLILPSLALAQTSTKCNPTEKTCPSDNGLNQASYTVDFTKGANKDWNMTWGDASYNSDGVAFTITKPKEAPTMQSDFYFFFGSVSTIAKAAPGTGIVSCVILESDDLDEIDWEWLGGFPTQVQTNYFGKGNTTTYNRGKTIDMADSQSSWHNYTIDWTPESTTWYIDGSAVRTLNFADAVGGKNYPQTPMRVKLGIWSASDTGAPGTIEWAGGNTDYSKAPFTMQVKSITINNANPAGSYSYGDKTGDWQSIKKSSSGGSSDSSTPSATTKAKSDQTSAIEISPDSSKTAEATSKAAAPTSSDAAKASAAASTMKTVEAPTSTQSSPATKTPTSFASSMFQLDSRVLSVVLAAALYRLL